MIKAQFNASTLKASFVAADKKAQMICVEYSEYDCGNCGNNPTPLKLKLTVSGLKDSGCFKYYLYGASWKNLGGLAAAIHSGSPYTLRQCTDNEDCPDNACAWVKIVHESLANYSFYDDKVCSSLEYTTDFDWLAIRVSIEWGGYLTVEMHVRNDATHRASPVCFEATQVSADSGCVGISSLANNTDSGWAACYDGTVKVEEV